jgi:hypothetical protein
VARIASESISIQDLSGDDGASPSNVIAWLFSRQPRNDDARNAP